MLDMLQSHYFSQSALHSMGPSRAARMTFKRDLPGPGSGIDAMSSVKQPYPWSNFIPDPAV